MCPLKATSFGRTLFLIWANPSLFLYFWLQGILQTMTLHINNQFISGFVSQQEGPRTGRYAPLLMTVCLRVPLTQTTADTMSIFEASWAASKVEWVAMLKLLQVMNRSRMYIKLKSSRKSKQRLQEYNYSMNWGKRNARHGNQTHILDMTGVKTWTKGEGCSR